MHRCLAVALSLCCAAVHADPSRLIHSSTVVVRDAPEEFGGLSALIVAADGTRAQILSDRGRLFEVGFLRDPEGVVERVAVLGSRYLYIYDPAASLDTEGLAGAPDGSIYVSTETPAQVLHYERGQSWPSPLAPFPQERVPKENRGLEALAIDPEGRPVAIPEAPTDGEAGFPIYRLDGDAWARIGTLEQRGSFLVVGADYGPDGRLYVLERSFSPLGFRSRIRRLALDDGAVREETLLLSRLGEFDNLEGISLWRDARGEIRVTLVSDDNFLWVQRTEIVEFILRE